MTKKIIKNANAILSALMLVSLLLAACGGGATPAAAAATVAPAAVVAEATAAATEAPAAVVAEATAAATEAPPAATAVPPTATAPPLDASCAGKGAVIQVHDWSSADRQEYWDQVIKAFNDAYPCIKAQTIKLPEDRAVRLTQLGGGTAPDLVAFDSSDLPLVFRMGYLSDLTPLMTTDKFDPAKQFYEGVYKTGIVDGKLVAVAKDYSVSAFYVNTGLLQKAGIAVPKEGWTYDDYLKMAQKLTVDKKGNNATSLDFDPANVAVYGTSSPQWGGDAAWWRGYQSFLYSWGAHTISPDGKATTGYINSTEAVAAWTWHRDLIHKHKVAPTASYLGASGVTNDKLFSEGKLAVSGSYWGPWYQDTFNKAANLQWQAVPLPTGPGGHKAAIMWMGWGINAKSAHPDEAWELLKWLTTEPGQQVFALKAMTGDIKTAETLPALKDPYWDVFMKEAPFQDQLDDMTTPFYTTCVDTPASKLMSKVFQDGGDKLDLKAELDALAAAADKCLKESTIQ